MIAAELELEFDRELKDYEILASFMGSGASDNITVKDLKEAIKALQKK